MAELGEMDLDELALWIAWYQEHDPALRDDWRTALLGSIIANCLTTGRRLKPHDIMPHLKPKPKTADIDQQLRAWVRASGGRINTPTKRADHGV